MALADGARRRYDEAVARYGAESPQAIEALWYLRNALREERGGYSSAWDRLWLDNAWRLGGIEGPGKKGDQYRADMDAAAGMGRGTPMRPLPNWRGTPMRPVSPTGPGTPMRPVDYQLEGPRQSMPVGGAGTSGQAGANADNGASRSNRETRIADDSVARSQRREAALARINASIAQWENLGLTNVRQIANRLVADGYSTSQVSTLLRENIMNSGEYKSLYGSVQEGQRKAGLPVMNPESIQIQRSAYESVMRRAGLPKGFYDDPSDFNNFLMNDVSPDEVAYRVNLAQQIMGESVQPEVLDAFRRYYGIGRGELTAYFLDPERAEPLLQKQAQAALIGAEALTSGVRGVGKRGFVEDLVEKGVDQMSARAAFGQVAEQQDTVRMLGDIEGERVSTRDQAEAVLGLDNNAEQRVRGLKSRERARFSGSAGGTRVLGSGDAAGSF